MLSSAGCPATIIISNNGPFKSILSNTTSIRQEFSDRFYQTICRINSKVWSQSKTQNEISALIQKRSLRTLKAFSSTFKIKTLKLQLRPHSSWLKRYSMTFNERKAFRLCQAHRLQPESRLTTSKKELRRATIGTSTWRYKRLLKIWSRTDLAPSSMTSQGVVATTTTGHLLMTDASWLLTTAQLNQLSTRRSANTRSQNYKSLPRTSRRVTWHKKPKTWSSSSVSSCTTWTLACRLNASEALESTWKASQCQKNCGNAMQLFNDETQGEAWIKDERDRLSQHLIHPRCKATQSTKETGLKLDSTWLTTRKFSAKISRRKNCLCLCSRNLD